MASGFDIILRAPTSPTSQFDIFLAEAVVVGDVLIIWLAEEAPG